jgi:DNA-binding transcriptional MerR regulator
MKRKEKMDAGPTYRIGAVSRLTGVAPDTLRVWERRYGAVVPHRSGAGGRQYSQEDVSRLALIKRLVDGGDAISSVANLTMEQLQERAKGAPFAQIESQLERPCRVVVLGTALPDRLGGETVEGDKIELVGLFRVREQFLSEAPKLNADVIVLEYATIQPDQIREIGTLLLRSGAGRAIVVYRVAARSTLDRIESPRIIPIRGPIDRAELHRWCLALHARAEEQPGFPVAHEIDLSGALPARRFDEASLARIAAASVTVRCECPHHLVDLISNLTAFEVYSEECEVLNVDDAALHAYLHSAAAQARSLLETALARVVEADAIEF